MVATDLNPPMLDRAKTRQASDRRLDLATGGCSETAVRGSTFDVVACQFGVMFFPDKVQGYREARRMLKPGGRFMFNVWDKISENEFADVVTQALAALFPQDPPRFMARTPHGYHDTDKIRDELKAAAICSIAIERRDSQSRAPRRDIPRSPIASTPLRTKSRATRRAWTRQQAGVGF